MTARRTAADSPSNQAFLTVRVIFFALAFSPLTFALVAWLVTDGGRAPFVGDTSAGLYAWAGLTMGGFLVWRFAWGRAGELVRRIERGGAEEDAPHTVGALQSRLVLAWVGAEAAGIAGPLNFFLAGGDLLLFASLLFAALLHHVSRPRRAWYRDVAGVAALGSSTGEPEIGIAGER